MAKRITALAFAVLLTAGLVFAQEEPSEQSGPQLEISGEMKTGVYWEQVFVDGKEFSEDARMRNNDDAGPSEGRFRLNLHLHKDNDMGMMVRFQQDKWAGTDANVWDYAMVYGNFINDQLKVTAGRLGLSPWGADSTDLLKDELDHQLGIRTEVMPGILPGLNIGFVLNSYNNGDFKLEEYDLVTGEQVSLISENRLVDMLMETVFGIAYTNDYFHGSVAFRLDGEEDGQYFLSANKYLQDNMELLYRLEERIIRQYLEGFSIWAVGYFKGLGEDVEKDEDSTFLFQNYLYIDYSPAAFSARLSGGLETSKGLQTVNGRAQFYYNILPVLSAGVAGKYSQQFGKYAADNASWGVEPQVRVTFNPNAYIALVYNYGQEYVFDRKTGDPVFDDETGKQVFSDKVQWINLRVVYTF